MAACNFSNTKYDHFLVHFQSPFSVVCSATTSWPRQGGASGLGNFRGEKWWSRNFHCGVNWVNDRPRATRRRVKIQLFARSLSMISRQDSSVTCIAESSLSVKARLNYDNSWKEGSVNEVMFVLLSNLWKWWCVIILLLNNHTCVEHLAISFQRIY